MRVLFVCTANELRSPTAEELFGSWADVDAISVGTDPSSANPISAEIVASADVIYAMEKHHRDRIRKKYKDRPRDSDIITLYIPDEYERNDPELIALLEWKVAPGLKSRLETKS